MLHRDFLFYHACWWCFPFYRVCRRRTWSARQVPYKTPMCCSPKMNHENLKLGLTAKVVRSRKFGCFGLTLLHRDFLFCHAYRWCFPFYRVCRRRTLSAPQVPSKTSELSGPGYFRNLEIGFRGRRDRTILIHHAHQKSSEN